MCSFLTHAEAVKVLSNEQYADLMHQINQLDAKTEVMSVRFEDLGNGVVDYSVVSLPIETDTSKYHWSYQEITSWLKGK